MSGWTAVQWWMPGAISFMAWVLPHRVGPRVAYQHRLGEEVDAELAPDAVGDLVRQREQLHGRAATAIGERERVLARQRDRARRAVAAREAGALDEPGRRRLHATVGLGERGRAGVRAE